VTDHERPEVFVYLSPEELAAAEAAAARAGLTLNAWIRRSLNWRVRRDQVARRFGLSTERGWWRWWGE
jgi:hypothetical protein